MVDAQADVYHEESVHEVLMCRSKDSYIASAHLCDATPALAPERGSSKKGQFQQIFDAGSVLVAVFG